MSLKTEFKKLRKTLCHLIMIKQSKEEIADKEIIKIYHECVGRIENSVPRIAVWHHEACRVMTNGDCEGRIFFYPTLTRITDSFSCSPLFLFIYIFSFIYSFI